MNTKIIFDNLITNGKQVFGYIDLGVTKENLTEAEMREAVDGWFGMKANVSIWLKVKE